MKNNKIHILILAAGKGTRMKSQKSKLLHSLAGLPVVGHVARTAAELNPETITVIHPEGGYDIYSAVKDVTNFGPIHSTVQKPVLGTGHAVLCVKEKLKDLTGTVLVLYGDTPLLKLETLIKLLEYRQSGLALVVLGMQVDHANTYGKLIVKDKKEKTATLEKIVEFANATEDEKQVRLCNSGVFAIDASIFPLLLNALKPDEKTGEYYLTDTVEIAVKLGYSCGVLEINSEELLGINNREDLALSEKILQTRYRQFFLNKGVTLRDPETIYFSYNTKIEEDVVIEPHVILGPHVQISSHAHIYPFCHLEEVQIGSFAKIGPFARLRGKTIIGQSAEIGNFVETKNLILQEGAKAKHLSYLGDSFIDEKTTIGAGTITCNYDGFNKWRTIIGKNVLVGSNTALIAPVTIGNDVVIGAGSTITDDIAENSLVISRSRQVDFKERGQKARQQKLQSKKQEH